MSRPFAPRLRVSSYLSAWMPTGDETRQSVAGYFGGGEDSARIDGIDKIAFPAETKTTLSATLTSARHGTGSMANSGVAGYFGGGSESGGPVSGIDKITFPADTKTTLSATLTQAVFYAAGLANSSVAGYFAGGRNASSKFDNIDKIAFPADTKTTLAAALTSVLNSAGVFANSGVAGYVGGGQFAAGANLTDRIDKIAFPADTKSTLAATLGGVNYTLTACADSGVAGYFTGGNDGVSVVYTSIDRLAFPAETRTTLGTTLSIGRSEQAGGMADIGVAGYFGGGTDGISAKLSSIDRLAFPAETRTTLSATLTTARQNLAGMANCGVF